MSIEYIAVFTGGAFVLLAFMLSRVSTRRVFWKYYGISLALLTVLSTFAIGYWGLGIGFLLAIVGGFLGLPALGLGLIALFTRWRRLRTFLLSVASLVAWCFVIANLAGRFEVQGQLTYCESLATAIQSYKVSNNHYPETLLEIEDTHTFKPLAIFFRGSTSACGYKAGVGTFWFRIPASGSYPSYWEYQSNLHTWRLLD